MLRKSLPLVALAAVLAFVAPAQAQQSPARSRVVMQVSDNDPANWNLALNNAKNIQADLGAANVDIEVVAYGPGINMLKADSVVGNRVGEALGAGVKIGGLREHDAQPEARQGRHAAEGRLRDGGRGRADAEATAGLGVHPPLNEDG
jgi:hypothetical protein